MKATLITSVQQAAVRLKTPLWLVGGPVRDELLGRSTDDWDMVCRRSKQVAQAVAKTLRAKFIVLDDQYRIYRVILPESFRPVHTLDFAELQGRTIEDDLARRDFTINAMARPLIPPSGTFSLKGEGQALPSPFRETGRTTIPIARPVPVRYGRVPVGRVRGVIDPFGGQRDLKMKIVRAVSERAFVEDPLRLVRAFRFAAQFQFAIEPRTLRAIRTHAPKLSKTAAERIREELLRLWKQPQASVALRQMDRAGLLAVIFPEVEACRRTAVRYYGKGGVLRHSFETVENLEWIFEQLQVPSPFSGEGGRRPGEGALSLALPREGGGDLKSYLKSLVGGYPRHAWLKWAAFLHDIGKPATGKMIKGRLRFFEHEHVGAALAIRIGQRLRLSRQEFQLLGLWVRNHMRTGSLAAAPRITDRALSRYFRDLGEEGVGMILVSLADHYTYLSRKLWGKGKDPVEKISQKLLTAYYQQRSKILPAKLVDGHDLMRTLKLKPGPMIGRILEKIQDAQAEGKVTTKEEALAFAKRKLVKSN